MKKNLKMLLCGMVATVAITGCTSQAEVEPVAGEEAVVATTEAVAGEDTEAEAVEAAATPEAQVAPTDLGSVTKLGEYKGLEATKNSTEVTDEEVTNQIDMVLSANPEEVEITDRPAQEGDTVTIDYVGLKDGVAFEGGTAEGYALTLGSNTFIEGFEEGLIGATVGQELSLNLTFPEAYASEDLAGAEVVFEVTVNSIIELKDATLTDEFAQANSDAETVDEYKEIVKEEIQVDKELQSEQQLQSELLLMVVDASEFELNEEAVDFEFNNQMSYYESLMQVYGGTIADFAEMQGMTEDQFKEELKLAAESAVKQQLLVKEIASAEELTPSQEDYDILTSQYGVTVDELKATYGEELVDDTALLFSVLRFLVDNATLS